MKRLVDAATVLAALAACAVAWGVLFGSPKPRIITYEDTPVPNWQEYASGHRLGEPDAPVTLTVWSDFQCPTCRALHSALKEVLPSHTHDVVLFARHWPLESHPFAYSAARAAECAGDQGAFFEFQDRLFENEDWLGDALVSFASAAGVSDLAHFRECIGRDAPVAEIEEDIRAAKSLGARGTPVVLVNGVYLGRPPLEPKALEEVLREARRRALESPSMRGSGASR